MEFKKIKEKTWQFEVLGDEREIKLFGVYIFDYQWEETGGKVRITDPIYKKEQYFQIFKVTINGEERHFAAGEFSNNVWGFYLFKY